jgi:hypothetical protein
MASHGIIESINPASEEVLKSFEFGIREFVNIQTVWIGPAVN